MLPAISVSTSEDSGSVTYRTYAKKTDVGLALLIRYI